MMNRSKWIEGRAAALRNRIGNVLPYFPMPVVDVRGRKPNILSCSFEKRSSQLGILHASSGEALACARHQHVEY